MFAAVSKFVLFQNVITGIPCQNSWYNHTMRKSVVKVFRSKLNGWHTSDLLNCFIFWSHFYKLTSHCYKTYLEWKVIQRNSRSQNVQDTLFWWSFHPHPTEVTACVRPWLAQWWWKHMLSATAFCWSKSENKWIFLNIYFVL